ncbi:MAG: hypothetical protein LUC31_00245 [Coprobacillus sp.]|nr:hypothetical protein [Coprobacillus sp.]
MKAVWVSIGNFFKRIGRWIKNTAWVQPLLIVAAIFIVVFAIPYIVVWVKSWYSSDAAYNYYKKFEVKLKKAEEGESEVDNLFDFLKDKDNGVETSADYPDKFFLTFVQEDCVGCDSAYEGFNYAQAHWNESGYEINDGRDFALYSIFIDTLDSDDDKNLFQDYIFDRVDTIFETVFGEYTESYYYQSFSEVLETDLENMISPDTFSSPTTFLIDFTVNNVAHEYSYGVSEVLFDYEGTANGGGSTTTPQAKATTIVDCWNHDGYFGKDYYDKNA